MRKVLRVVILGGCSLAAMGANPAFAQQPYAMPPRGGAGPGYGQAIANAPAPLAWLDNVDAALQQAATQRRLVLVHFWSDNCPPCVGVERNVLSRPEVQQAIQANFIPVKIKVDSQPGIAERFRVDRWPTDLILLPDGQELVRSVSSQDPARYNAFLARAASVLNSVNNAAESTQRSAQAARGQFAAFQQDVARDAFNAGNMAATATQQTANSTASAAQDFANNAYGQVNNAANQFNNAANQVTNTAGQVTGQMAGQVTNQLANQAAMANAFAPPASPGTPTVGQGGYGLPPLPPAMPAPSNGGRFMPGGAMPSSGVRAPQGMVSPAGMSAPTDGGGVRGGIASAGVVAGPVGGAGPVGNAGSGVGTGSGMGSGPGIGSGPGNGSGPIVGGGPGGNSGGVRGGGGAGSLGAGGAAASQPSAIGLDGYCPVTLFETRKWRRADARWGVVHRDRTYLFAGPEQQQKFLEDPDRYAPMLSGFDPVRYLEQGQLVEGRRQHGLWYRNQMFLFADEASLEQFWKNAEGFAPRVEQAMQRPVAGGPIRR